MHFLLRIVQAIYDFVRLVVSFVTGTASKSLRHPWMFHALHVGFVVAATVLLAVFNDRLTAALGFVTPNVPPLVRRFFLAIVFLAAYASVRALILVVQLFLMRSTAEFEDIERAWREGVARLESHGVDLSWCPLYLTLGLGRAEEKHFFEATRFPWIGAVPEDPHAPIRFHFDGERIYVACPGVGCTAEHVATPHEGRDAGSRGGDTSAALAGVEAARTMDLQGLGRPALGDTVVPGGFGGTPAGGTMNLPQSFGGTMIGLPGAGRRAPGSVAASAAAPARIGPLPPSVAARQTRRLEFLAELVRDGRRETNVVRGSVCSTNGVLVGLPLEWSATSTGIHAAESVARDLQTLQESLGQTFPVVAVETGLERVAGFEEFLTRSSEWAQGFKYKRLGSGLPDGNRLAEKERTWLVDRALHGSILSVVYTTLSHDIAHATNRRLFHLLCSLIERRDRLLQQLEHAFGAADSLRFVGMYFAAAGDQPRQKCGVHGVLERLDESQGQVAWTDARIASNSRMTALAVVLYVVGLAGLGGCAWYGWHLFGRT